MSARTRFSELTYAQTSPGCWRIMDADEAVIGPLYASRAELLADLERYANNYFGVPNPRMDALTAENARLREALDEAAELLKRYDRPDRWGLGFAIDKFLERHALAGGEK